MVSPRYFLIDSDLHHPRVGSTTNSITTLSYNSYCGMRARSDLEQMVFDVMYGEFDKIRPIRLDNPNYGTYMDSAVDFLSNTGRILPGGE